LEAKTPGARWVARRACPTRSADIKPALMEVFSGVGGAEYLSRLASSDPAHFARCLAR